MKKASEHFSALSAPANLAILALAVVLIGSVRALITSCVPAVSPTSAVLLSSALRVLFLFLPFALLERFASGRFAGSLSVGGHTLKRLPMYFAAMQLVSVISGFLVRTVCTALFPSADALLAVPSDYGGFGITALIAEAVDLCILTPLIEEYVFRGVIYGILKRHGTRFAVISSAFIFAIAHGTVDRMAYAFFAGLLLALLYSRTHDLRVTVLLHALNNFTGLLIDALLPRMLSEHAQYIVLEVYLLLIAVFGTVSVIVLRRAFLSDTDGGWHDKR